jgi:hypothetical protein
VYTPWELTPKLPALLSLPVTFAPQNPTLQLAPHVAAPGAYISVETMHGSSYRASGTSFSSPYIAGVLALWLQAHQQQAERSGKPLTAREANQAAALRGLVSTAKGVKNGDNQQFLEPVAKLGAGKAYFVQWLYYWQRQATCMYDQHWHEHVLFFCLRMLLLLSILAAASQLYHQVAILNRSRPLVALSCCAALCNVLSTPGVIQVDAFLSNQLRVSPYMLSLPSNITQPTAFSFNLTWDPSARPSAAAAPTAAAANVTYSVLHEPAAAITVSNGWYGSANAIEYVYQAADVKFGSSKVAVSTASGAQTELKVWTLHRPCCTGCTARCVCHNDRPHMCHARCARTIIWHASPAVLLDCR